MMAYPFNLDVLAHAIRPADEEQQLRRDFPFPPEARDLALTELQCDGKHARYFERTIMWRQLVQRWRYNFFTRRYEQTERWEYFSLKLEPSYKQYLT
jgi:hypothetical protein